jgi:hypothetical protein
MKARLPPANRPLLRKIHAALAEHPGADGVRISITAEPSPERKPDGSSIVVKWLCWNLTQGEGYATDPVLAMVHAGLSEEALRADLAAYFEGYQQVVDNEITFSDDDDA